MKKTNKKQIKHMKCFFKNQKKRKTGEMQQEIVLQLRQKKTNFELKNGKYKKHKEKSLNPGP